MFDVIIVAYNKSLDEIAPLAFVQECPLVNSVFIWDNSEPTRLCNEATTSAKVHILFSGENVGLSKAYNRALDRCKSDFVCLMDDDTVFPHCFFERAVANIQKAYADIYVPIVTENGKIYSPCNASGRLLENIDSMSQLDSSNLSAINSGMIIRRSSFPGSPWDEKLFLDYVDFCFVKNARKDGKSLAVMRDVWIHQSFSFNQPDYKEDLRRRRIQNKDFFAYYNESISDKVYARAFFLKKELSRIIPKDSFARRIYRSTKNVIRVHKEANHALQEMAELKKARHGLVLVSHDCSKSGAPILLKHIASEIEKRGVDLIIISRVGGELFSEYERIAPTFVVNNPRAVELTLKKLARLGYNRVLCNTVINSTVRANRVKEIARSILLIHELPEAIRTLSFEEQCPQAADNFDQLVFPSSYVKSKFEQLAGCVPNFVIAPQAVHHALCDNSSVSYTDESIYEMFKVRRDAPLVLGVGFGDKRKGFDLFIKMAQDKPNLEWLWLGDYDEFILEESAPESIPNNLHLPGFVTSPDLLSKCYQKASLLALTSREDPFPSCVLEAFSFGLPVVAFADSGGFSDIVITGKTGTLVNSEDVPGFEQAVEDLLANASLRANMGENCKQYSASNTFEDYVSKLLRLLDL